MVPRVLDPEMIGREALGQVDLVAEFATGCGVMLLWQKMKIMIIDRGRPRHLVLIIEIPNLLIVLTAPACFSLHGSTARGHENRLNAPITR